MIKEKLENIPEEDAMQQMDALLSKKSSSDNDEKHYHLYIRFVTNESDDKFIDMPVLVKTTKTDHELIFTIAVNGLKGYYSPLKDFNPIVLEVKTVDKYLYFALSTLMLNIDDGK